MRQVRQIMGMPITIDIPKAESSRIFEAVFEVLKQIDTQFSTYRKNSEVCKYARGEIKTPSKSLAKVISECQEAEAYTDGYFSVWYNNKFDPSGYVKGWAIAEAGKLIEKSGYKTYCISTGGDILARSDSDKVWKIGIQDPQDPKQILNMLSISNGAVATSGNYERGNHIYNPKTKKPATDFLSVTVTGPDIIKADILATAVLAAGTQNLDFMKIQKDYQALTIIHRSQGSNR